jgi:hypothetical protein
MGSSTYFTIFCGSKMVKYVDDPIFSKQHDTYECCQHQYGQHGDAAGCAEDDCTCGDHQICCRPAGGGHDAGEDDDEDSGDRQTQPADKSLSGGTVTPPAVQPVDKQEDDERRQRDRDESQSGAAEAANQIAEADDPEAGRSGTDLSNGKGFGELAIGGPSARQQILVNDGEVPRTGRRKQRGAEHDPEKREWMRHHRLLSLLLARHDLPLR